MQDGNGSPEKSARDSAQAWVHRENIRRYRALLRNEGDAETYARIETLLGEEEERLRSIEGRGGI